MKRLLLVFAIALVLAVNIVPAMAGPSRAIVQEMGSVVTKDEINVDVDWISHTLNVAGSDDLQAGEGDRTVGGITFSSLNVGLTDNIEARVGRMPGFRSYLHLPVGSGNNYGLTLKGTIPGVSGLAGWVGYGFFNREDVSSGDSSGDDKGSSFRVGAAYTWAGPVVLNGSLAYAMDRSETAGIDGPDTDTFEVAAALLYPVKPSLLVGAELHYLDIDADTVKVKAFVPVLGARLLAGNWTMDVIFAELGASVDTDISGADTAKGTELGIPSLRVNYKF